MADLKIRFENELKLKLGQKSKANQTNETFLVKSFRYFDLDNSGIVTRDEFQKAIQKIGVTSFEDKEVNQLFHMYDTNRNGELDYKEFAAIIFSGNVVEQFQKTGYSERPSTSTTQSRTSENQADEIIQNLKKNLAAKGATGLINLAKAFRFADKYQDKKIEFQDFYGVLEDSRIDLPFKQAEKLFASLNKSGSGLINYEDFLTLLKGRLSTNRRNAITQVFLKLDKDRDNQVDLSDVKGYYDASRHPDVIRGNRNEQDVAREFITALDGFASYRKLKNASITGEEFEDLFAFIGVSIEDEQRFLTMMSNVWKSSHTTEYSDYKPWSQRPPTKNFDDTRSELSSMAPLEDVEQNLTFIFQRFRQRLSYKGIKGFVGLYKLFRNVDYNDSGVVSTKEFSKILKDYKMEVPEQDSIYLFAHYDPNRHGSINYENFMKKIIGSLSFERREVVGNAWRKLDYSMSGKVQLAAVKALFKDLRNHPDVKSGRKSQEQVAIELNEVLDFHHNVMARSSSQFINQKEFEDFLLYLSATITDDKYFEAVVHTIFKLETERNYTDTYAGAGRKDYDPRGGYLKDFHRSTLQGGSVSSNAPFGTDNQSNYRPTTSHYNYNDDTKSSRQGSQFQYSPNRNYQDIYSSRDVPSERTSFSDRESQISVDGEGIDEVRRKIIGRGIRGILGIVKSLRLLDTDKYKNLPVNSFIKALNDYRLDIDGERFRYALESSKLIQNGRVDYEKFLKMVKGEMNTFRHKLVTGTYERINADRKGYVTVDDIKDIFDPRHHPDVRAQRREEDDVALEHLEAIDLHHMIFTTSVKGKDKRVSLEEFVDYYDHYSCLIENDKQFEHMMTNCWRTYPTSTKDSWRDDESQASFKSQSQKGYYGGGRY